MSEKLTLNIKEMSILSRDILALEDEIICLKNQIYSINVSYGSSAEIEIQYNLFYNQMMNYMSIESLVPASNDGKYTIIDTESYAKFLEKELEAKEAKLKELKDYEVVVDLKSSSRSLSLEFRKRMDY